MAKVYLPMGYPIQSGLQFANVIYQGRFVRMYQNAPDPRTPAQLSARRFLADASRTRAQMGDVMRFLLRVGLGSTWSTIFTQLIKGDLDGSWSAAAAAWDSFLQVEKDSWAEFAPHAATWNEPGFIFYCVFRSALEAISAHGSSNLTDWIPGYLSGALFSSAEDARNFFVGSYPTIPDAVTSYVIDWWFIGSLYTDGGLWEQYSPDVRCTGAGRAAFFFNGLSGWLGIQGFGTCEVYFDGVLLWSGSVASGSNYETILWSALKRGKHLFSFNVTSGYIEFGQLYFD